MLIFLTILSTSFMSSLELFFCQSDSFPYYVTLSSISASTYPTLAILQRIIIINIIIIIIINSLEFFTSALADGLSLEFEWQQDSSNLRESSRDSGCSQ